MTGLGDMILEVCITLTVYELVLAMKEQRKEKDWMLETFSLTLILLPFSALRLHPSLPLAPVENLPLLLLLPL